MGWQCFEHINVCWLNANWADTMYGVPTGNAAFVTLSAERQLGGHHVWCPYRERSDCDLAGGTVKNVSYKYYVIRALQHLCTASSVHCVIRALQHLCTASFAHRVIRAPRHPRIASFVHYSIRAPRHPCIASFAHRVIRASRHSRIASFAHRVIRAPRHPRIAS
ncbi:MAG: hypothetical protein RSA55_08855, partial [Clostridia bacterium]